MTKKEKKLLTAIFDGISDKVTNFDIQLGCAMGDYISPEMIEFEKLLNRTK